MAKIGNILVVVRLSVRETTWGYNLPLLQARVRVGRKDHRDWFELCHNAPQSMNKML